MPDWMWAVGFVALYIVVTQWLLRKLGVPQLTSVTDTHADPYCVRKASGGCSVTAEASSPRSVIRFTAVPPSP
jgi:hypothetical protein